MNNDSLVKTNTIMTKCYGQLHLEENPNSRSNIITSSFPTPWLHLNQTKISMDHITIVLFLPIRRHVELDQRVNTVNADAFEDLLCR